MIPINDMVNMTFRRVAGKDLSAYKSDLQTFNILTAMDGKRSIGTIAREDFYDVKTLSQQVQKLLDLGLLEPVQGSGNAVDHDIFKDMQTELTRLIGPVAGMLLKNSAAKLGHDINNFPAGKIGELLDMVSKYIQNPGKAADFQRRMLARIRG